MKTTIAIALSGAFLTFAVLPATAAEEAKLAAEAHTVVKGFMTELKGTLVGAMKEAGPVHAIGVCKTKAAPIAMNAAKKSGWKVGRTALKLRNASNRADDWERSAMKDFIAKAKGGADLKKLERFEVVSEGGKKMFRYMKAIPTGKPCLNCHGAELKPQVKTKLGELYPLDKATGFQLGQLRGAFTLSKEIQQ